ncbi:MAG: ATP-binding cassette domain-containing protein, partial [Phycicoccus sp.]
SGKSTLLRALAGEHPLAAGRRRQGVTVRPAFLTQEVRELDALAGRRVIEAVESVRSSVRLGARELSASQLAQRLGFTGPRQPTRVGDLSGGERRRLQLTRLLMDEPNVLLLDEPTNDLDIDTLTSLEDVLDGWPGTLVVVSHDRYLLERVCDRQVALLGDGRLRDLPGGVEEYLRLRADAAARRGSPSGTAQETGARPGSGSRARPDRADGGATTTGRAGGLPVEAGGSSSAIVGGSSSGSRSPGAVPPLGAGASGPSPAEMRESRKIMARVERALSRLTEREQRLHAQLAEAAADHARVLDLDGELRALLEEREALEVEWLTAAETAG